MYTSKFARMRVRHVRALLLSLEMVVIGGLPVPITSYNDSPYLLDQR
jgi:hypothetical protein